MFSVRLLKNAIRQLRKLDPPVARRIVGRIKWLSEHSDEIVPEPMGGDLAGLFKCREGDYRTLYEPLHEEEVIVVYEIGHRRVIYKSRRS